jgi:hypothetical protein
MSGIKIVYFNGNILGEEGVLLQSGMQKGDVINVKPRKHSLALHIMQTAVIFYASTSLPRGLFLHLKHYRHL